MSKPLTPEYLAELRALCEASTPGPWTVGKHDVGGYYRGMVPEWYLNGPNNETPADRLYEADATFIAAARTGLPRLFDRLDALVLELQTARETAQALQARLDRLEGRAAPICHAPERARVDACAPRADDPGCPRWGVCQAKEKHR